MSVNVSITIGPCSPVIPVEARVAIDYAGERREMEWTYVETIDAGARGVMIDRYTISISNLSEPNVTDTMYAKGIGRNLNGDKPDAGPLQRAIADYLGSVLPTILAVDHDHVPAPPEPHVHTVETPGNTVDESACGQHLCPVTSLPVEFVGTRSNAAGPGGDYWQHADGSVCSMHEAHLDA